jgi:tetratricopeptide (TPR) repeat protein
VRALEATGVEVVLGEFKKKTRRCRQCGKDYNTFEEKETDVNIALRVLELAAQDEFDVGIVISGGSDLVPVVQSVRRVAPAKTIGVLLPMGQRSESFEGYRRFGDALADGFFLPDAYERLGMLYEERGDIEKAIYYYGLLAELWKDADPELQPWVEAARRAIEALSTDR